MNKKRRYFKRHYKNAGNFLIAVQSFLIVAAVVAVLFFCFEYKHESPAEKIQKTVMSRIDFNKNSEFFRQLEMRDPGRIFGIPDGGFKALKKEFNHKKIFSKKLEMPEKKDISTGKFLPIQENVFPPSPRNSIPVLPEKNIVKPGKNIVINPNGKIIAIDLKNNENISKKSLIKIYSVRSIKRYRIIQSCGNIQYDKIAGKEILKLDDVNGIYTVIWAEKEVNKK